MVNIFWGAVCPEATAQSEMPTLRYLNQDYADQQVLEITLPIENEVQPAPAASELKDGSLSLRLSLQDAVRYTIQNNKDIQYYSYNPPQAIEALAIANSVYDPSFFESFVYNSAERPIENILDIGSVEGVLIEDRSNLQIGVKKPLATGGMFSLFLDTNYLDSTSDAVIPNPQHVAKFTAQIRQSLLKEFGDKSNKATIEIASINIDRSKEEFRTEVTSVLQNVAKTYWQLLYDLRYEEIRRDSLAMAEEVYRWEKTRLEQGIANPVDVEQAEAAVETRRIELDQAGNQIDASLKYLHQIMGFPFADTLGNTPDIVPTESPKTKLIEISEAETLTKALESRPEMIAAQKASDAADTRQKLARHQLLPTFDAKASYTFNSLDQEFGRSLDEAFFSDKNTWVVGFEFEYPLGNNKASAEYRKSMLGYKQAQREVAKTGEMINLEVSLAVKDVLFYGQKVHNTSEVEKTLESVVAGKKTQFEIAQINNDELLYAQGLLTDARIEKLKATVTYNLKLSELSKAQGTLLADMGISLQ